MIGKRTQIDFSKHEVIVTENEHLKMYHFKEPGTRMHSVCFINAGGIMAVTGDFGNWIFCREFWPGKDGQVSDFYWIEKLSIASTQVAQEFDADATEKELKKLIAGGYAEWGFEGDELNEMIEYGNECLRDLGDGEGNYKHTAFDSLPGFCDFESVVIEKKTKHWLLCVFDAFEAMCSLMKEEEIINP